MNTRADLIDFGRYRLWVLRSGVQSSSPTAAPRVGGECGGRTGNWVWGRSYTETAEHEVWLNGLNGGPAAPLLDLLCRKNFTAFFLARKTGEGLPPQRGRASCGVSFGRFICAV